jgi:hypothetical protein
LITVADNDRGRAADLPEHSPPIGTTYIGLQTMAIECGSEAFVRQWCIPSISEMRELRDTYRTRSTSGREPPIGSLALARSRKRTIAFGDASDGAIVDADATASLHSCRRAAPCG